MKVRLCMFCEACPSVEFIGNEVLIGEEQNLVKLKKEEWNTLVKKIKSGELKEL
ncbi:MAG: hypothetical protein ACE5K4_11185 [Candidatus Hydrothermarchaeota archaeon]